MYDYIKGKLILKNSPNIVVECGGIGYCAVSNPRVIDKLPNVGEDVKIYTKLLHREDFMGLCGFSHKEDRVIFDILTTVNGVGTKAGLTLLDEFSATELIGAVIEGDYKQISRAKGIGPKLAQKIILELKDKLTSNQTAAAMAVSKISVGALSNETVEEVQTILNSLGYTYNEIADSMDAALRIAVKDDSQELLRIVLGILSNNG